MRNLVIFVIGAAAAACAWTEPDPTGRDMAAAGTSSSGGTGCVGDASAGGPMGASSGGSSSGATGGSSGAPAAAGWFRTDGAKIVDSMGKTVRITGVNWFGLETANFAPHGLWSRSMGDMLDQMKQLGFNAIRVPFSNQLFDAGSTPNGIDYNQNPDLKNLSGPEILDKLVEGAKARGLRILLDRHRPDANGQSPLWYTDQVSEQRWIDDWKKLADKYKNEPTVIGADLHNEPHGQATWGDGNMATDWRLAAERAGNAILAENPNWLIVVEGVEAVSNDYYWWGGNLRAAAANQVTLSVPNRVVYSPHDYPASVYAQSWFSAPNYPANLATVWDDTWGHLATQGTAPILVGEFGTKYATSVDQQWLSSLVAYLSKNGMSFTFWSWNPDSGDTGGILADDWKTVNTDKMNVLKPALAPML